MLIIFPCSSVNSAKYQDTSINDIVLRNGCACLKTNIAKNEDLYRSMKAQEDIAESAGKGIWGTGKNFARKDIIWNVENLSQFQKIFGTEPKNIIIEQVIDCSLLRALFIKDNTWYYFLLKIAGIKAPVGDTDDVLESKLALEKLTLQQDATFQIECIWANQYMLGTVACKVIPF